MVRNFLALGVSTLVRALTGFLLFVLIARHWGASDFGHFMYLFSVASVLVLACEFGFSQQILREVGRTPEQAAALMARYLGAKIWLTALAFVLALGFALLTGLTWGQTAILLYLLLAATVLSYADFLLACLRALGRFANETVVALKGNLLLFVLAVAALYGGGGFAGVALAMVMARVAQWWLAHQVYRRHVGPAEPLQLQWRAVWPVVRGSAPYGVDGAVAQIFSNIDTILISHVLGHAATGLYQAGARFYQGACMLAPIFGSLYLPRLSRATAPGFDDKSVFNLHFRQLSIGLLVSGLLLSLGFVFSDKYIGIIFGSGEFDQLRTLLPWFGVLLLLRFGASIYGTVLTALGGQRVRVFIYLLALLSLIPAALLLMPRFGVTGMVLAVIVAHLVLTAGLSWRIAHYRLRVSGLFALLLALLLLTVFVYWNSGL